MDACLAVEKELDKVLSKFGNIYENCDRLMSELISFIEDVNTEFRQGEWLSRTIATTTRSHVLQFLAPDGYELSKYQKEVFRQALKKIKETIFQVATEHREHHSTISKVGKAIDRNFVPDFAATSRDDVFAAPDKINLINKVICEHFCRHGLQDVAQELAKVCYLELK